MSFVFYELYSQHEPSCKKRHPRIFFRIILTIWAGLFCIMFLLVIGFPFHTIKNLIPCGILKNCGTIIQAQALLEKENVELNDIVRGAADVQLTRGQMAIYLKDMLLKRGLIDQRYVNDSLKMETVSFSDVAPMHAAYSASRVLARRNIIKGKKEDEKVGVFLKPDDLINRAEMAALLVRGLEVPVLISGGAPHFSDVEEGHWFYRYVETLYSHEALSEAEFQPGVIATEGFLQEILKKL